MIFRKAKVERERVTEKMAEEAKEKVVETADAPKYVAYAINHDGVYLWDLQTKKLRHYLPLADVKCGIHTDHTYIASILAFNEEFLVLVLSGCCLCKYNWKTRTMVSCALMHSHLDCSFTQASEFWRSTYDLTNVSVKDLVYLPYSSDCYLTCASDERLPQHPRVPVKLETFVPKIPFTHYWEWHHRDLRGYSFIVSLDYDVQINDADDKPIWVDDTISKKLRKESSLAAPYAQITTVALLNCLPGDLLAFAKKLQPFLPYLFEEFALIVAGYL